MMEGSMEEREGKRSKIPHLLFENLKEGFSEEDEINDGFLHVPASASQPRTHRSPRLPRFQIHSFLFVGFVRTS
jgi:hypothetical protein